MGRRSVVERLKQKPETLLRFARRHVQKLKDPHLLASTVVPYAPAPQLNTVEDEVIRPGPRPGGIGRKKLKVAGVNGTLERVLRRPFRPRPVTPAMQEAERKRQLDQLEAGGGPQVRMMVQGPGGAQPRTVGQDAVKEMMKNRIAEMRFYPELPVVMDLATGWSGKIWVVRRGDQPTEEGPIDVLTPAGQYVGTFAKGSLELPEAFGPEGMVAFVERDEFDVPTVVVKRLPAVLR